MFSVRYKLKKKTPSILFSGGGGATNANELFLLSFAGLLLTTHNSKIENTRYSVDAQDFALVKFHNSQLNKLSNLSLVCAPIQTHLIS